MFISVLVFDQWLKYWVRTNLRQGQSISWGPLQGYADLTLSYNQGIAFGAFQGFALFMAPIAVAIAFFAFRSFQKHHSISRWNTVAMSLLAAGAIGNLVDRVGNPSRGVTDMFLLRLSNMTGGKLSDFPVFNVADVAICTAMVMLGIVWFREPNSETKPNTTEAQSP
jgi:signal peptidase II